MKVGNAKYVKAGSNLVWQADAAGEVKIRKRCANQMRSLPTGPLDRYG